MVKHPQEDLDIFWYNQLSEIRSIAFNSFYRQLLTDNPANISLVYRNIEKRSGLIIIILFQQWASQAQHTP